LAADTTFGDLANRIADELGARTDLLVASTGLTDSPIQLAILDAVSYWANERFYFNEYRTAGAFSTVAGQEFYTSADWADIATILHIDKLSVLISGNRYFMVPRTEEYLEDISINPSWRGQPVDYAYYNFQLRFYPIPDNAYPVNVLGTKYFAALSGASDTNVWTTTAEPMIRATAKMYLYRDTLQDDARAQAMAQAMQFEYSSLKGGTFKKAAGTRMKPTMF
jgi:hypothetical protein